MASVKSEFTDFFSLPEIFDTLFSAPIPRYGKGSVSVEDKLAAAEKLFSTVKGWMTPSLNAISKKVTDTISNNIEGFSQDEEEYARLSDIINIAIEMASEEVDHAYHSNFHYLVEVPIMTSLLGYEALQAGEIKKEDMAYMMIAAFVHDYAHDGGVNGEKQFRLEQQSLDAAKEQLSAAGLTEEEFENIITPMVLATDVSGENPAASLKEYLVTEDPSVLKFGKEINDLFVKNPKLIQMALMLHEGDIGASAALSEEYGSSRTEDVKKETGDKGVSFAGFFKFVLGEEGFVSEMGKKMLRGQFKNIKRRLKLREDLQNGLRNLKLT